MTAFSNKAETDVLNQTLNGDAPTPDYTGSLWVALFTSAGSAANLEAGTLTGEVSGGSYARVAMDSTSANKWTVSGDTASNTAAVTFPTATADWTAGGTTPITYVAVMDASTAGNVLYYGTLTATKIVENGDTLSFGIGDLTVTLA